MKDFSLFRPKGFSLGCLCRPCIHCFYLLGRLFLCGILWRPISLSHLASLTLDKLGVTTDFCLWFKAWPGFGFLGGQSTFDYSPFSLAPFELHISSWLMPTSSLFQFSAWRSLVGLPCTCLSFLREFPVENQSIYKQGVLTTEPSRRTGIWLRGFTLLP